MIVAPIAVAIMGLALSIFAINSNFDNSHVVLSASVEAMHPYTLAFMLAFSNASLMP